jgi:hypothetical protein
MFEDRDLHIDGAEVNLRPESSPLWTQFSSFSWSYNLFWRETDMQPRVKPVGYTGSHKISACYVQTEIDCKALVYEPDNRQ